MTPTVLVLVGWVLFAGTHVVLATPVWRERLISAFGHLGFVALYSAVAWFTFAALVSTYATVRWEGASGPNLGSIEGIRWVLLLFSGLGWVLMFSSLGPSGYASAPMALFTETVRGPYGMERITRHPVFAGTATWALAHLLLAPTLAGAVFFAGFFALSTGGAFLQDRRLSLRKGPDYARFVEATSFVPFAAIAAGRQRLSLGELPWGWLLFGVCGAVGLRAYHVSLLAYGGLPLLLFFSMGPILFATSNWWVNRGGSAPSAR